MRKNDFTNRSAGLIRHAGKGYDYFLPNLEIPNVEYTSEFIHTLSLAERMIGELAGIGGQLPNPDVLVLPFMRQEAVESSRIEGTEASLEDLLLGDIGERPIAPSDDIEEVQNYVVAMNKGLELLKKLPLSVHLLKELHAILMKGVRGQHATPGNIRKSQNWIGPPGSTLATATFVPPAPHELVNLLSKWEKLLHSKNALPPLLHVAVLHHQFESIHPFLDGNGRIGRLLITLYLYERQELPLPLLPLSVFLERHRSDYYAHLLSVNQKGTWQEWLQFFVGGVATQAEESLGVARSIIHLQASYTETLHKKRANRTTLQVLTHLFHHPYTTTTVIEKLLKVSKPTARAALNTLVRMKIAKKKAGSGRTQLYFMPELLTILDINSV
jgi:Fic family protein